MVNAVVTGMGIVSCIGNSVDEVTESLKKGQSGIIFNEKYRDMGFRSHVSGSIDLDVTELIDRKTLRFMSKAAAYAYIASNQALMQANIEISNLDRSRIGVVAGSGGASPAAQIVASDIAREKGPKRIGPYSVTKTMGSTVSACLGTALKTQGVSYSISSACSTSAHCIGHAAELIAVSYTHLTLPTT